MSMGLCGVALFAAAGCKGAGMAADSSKSASSAPADEAAVRKSIASLDSQFVVARRL
jgi:hypothetical protein